jgi:hypothetical protein
MGGGEAATMNTDAFNLERNPYWALLLHAQALNAKLLQFSADNFLSSLNFFNDLARASTSPSSIHDVVVNKTRDQFETMTEQIEELSETAQGGPPGEDDVVPILGD